MASTSITILLDDDLRQRLEEVARAERRSASALVVEAIEEMLTEKAARRDLVLEALNEAEKGEFISEEAVLSWFEKLDAERDVPLPKPDVSVRKG